MPLPTRLRSSGLILLLATAAAAFAPSFRRPAGTVVAPRVGSDVSKTAAVPTPDRVAFRGLRMSATGDADVFQALLRDLQIEGVPLLACDADQVHTLCAALWTTLAEMSESDSEEKACLVMESIPLDALKAFIDDFAVLKGQPRLMDHLPELRRLSVSLVGKGVGPALVLESVARSEAEKAEKAARAAVEASLD